MESTMHLVTVAKYGKDNLVTTTYMLQCAPDHQNA